MLEIVNALNPTGISLKKAQIASGACIPDGIEVLHMLKYLTSQGTVIQENGYYLKRELPTSKATMPKRTNLIQELDSLLDMLSNTPQSVENLSNRIDWTHNSEELESFLKFLIQINAKGPIQGKISLLGRFFQRGKWVVA